MVSLVAAGVLLISTGPTLAIWAAMLQRRPHLFVVSILSAFFWCIAIMLSSAVWHAIPPLKTIYLWPIFLSVTFQELCRYGLYIGFRNISRFGDGVRAFVPPGTKNEIITGMCVGVGFGVMSVLINFVSVLVDEFADETAIHLPTCPFNFVVIGSTMAMAFSILHILLGALVWPSYSHVSRNTHIFVGYVLHLAIAEVTLINRREDGCLWGFGIIWALVTLSAIFTFTISKSRINTPVAIDGRNPVKIPDPERRPIHPGTLPGSGSGTVAPLNIGQDSLSSEQTRSSPSRNESL